MMFKRLACLLMPAFLGACALGPDYQRPQAEFEEAYVQPTETGESVANLPWWELFQDPVLQHLIRAALEENKDLAIAASRILEAQAILGITRSEYFPTVDAQVSAARGQGSAQVFPGSIDSSIGDNYVVGLGVGWEVDLFGRLRRSNEAARAQLLATEYAYQALSISLVAGVADAYMLLRDLDQQLEISQRTYATRAHSLEIMRARFDKGTVPLLDVNQAEIELESAAASVAASDRVVAQTEYALSVLLGRNPGPIVRGETLSQQSLPPVIPSGLPSELLKQRPDIRAAEQQLVAQTARIGVAEAARWPSLQLTGSLGFESGELSELSASDADFWNLGANLLAPVFNAGRNKNRVEAEKARTEQALQTYVKTIQQALREVEDALVAVRTYRTENAARKRQVEAARSAARLSRARYDGGVTSYLEVLDTERSLFQSELSASQTSRQELTAIIQLYKALGGGWTP
ncbi:MAG: efflux transporter outer membrane subunit [Gammaproteobacteria bacterium]|nr:efflux transporter outer membrane subunit [Gammaproteobacteria bacterium]